MDIHTHNYKVIILPPNLRPGFFDFDPVFKNIYWTDFRYYTILKTSLDDGKTTEFLRLPQYTSVKALAVDPLSRLLFIAEQKHGIRVVSLNTMKIAHVLTNNSRPTDIELDLIKRKLYWCDNSNKIEVADYDGSNRRIILSNITCYDEIALDTSRNVIYWPNRFAGRIERVNFDGSNRQNITVANGTIIFKMEVDGVMLYYTDYRASSVMAVPVSGGFPHQIGKDGFGNFLAIKRNKEDYSNTDANNGCLLNNGGCEHICVPLSTKNSRTCFCTDGYNSSANGSCIGYPLKVRLSGANNTNEGRVEVTIDNGATWGTVCINGFGVDEANVICKMLGMASDRSVPQSSFKPASSSQHLIISGLNCGGNESA
ncbi:hypothetical protein DPMN_192153 [Dreissena polymorpha]|uniref:SRCR domain-containing protein n=2 Tax=Dreissena polymorpha TaxID=45954 RepID=A0A9D3XXN0_DREPO|nr:hypothetical protein DPMN_192153 [Dreissena polymorpha]